jgi:hypothetical protein
MPENAAREIPVPQISLASARRPSMIACTGARMIVAAFARHRRLLSLRSLSPRLRATNASYRFRGLPGVCLAIDAHDGSAPVTGVPAELGGCNVEVIGDALGSDLEDNAAASCIGSDNVGLGGRHAHRDYLFWSGHVCMDTRFPPETPKQQKELVWRLSL